MESWAHPPGRYPAHCSLEFGLSSPPMLARAANLVLLPEWAGRPSGPAANTFIICDAGRKKGPSWYVLRRSLLAAGPSAFRFCLEPIGSCVTPYPPFLAKSLNLKERAKNALANLWAQRT